MVLLIQSPEIKEFLASLKDTKSLDSNKDLTLETTENAPDEKVAKPASDVIDHTELVKLLKLQSKYTLAKLVKTTSFYHKPLPTRTPSPEYVKLMDHYRQLAAEREYKEMTGKYDREFTSSDWKTVNSLMVSIGNVFFSVGAVFVATFMLGEYAGVDIAIRVLVGLAMGAIVFFAEGWFFTKDWISTKV
ncbi:hypothetical protein HDV01_001080 [Terramyces sp. JEL0728]|nr:hypothetical protein HDV01_001080 [Terramyces sp. JEL0728]